MTKFGITLLSILLAIYTYTPTTTAKINGLYIEFIINPPFLSVRHNSQYSLGIYSLYINILNVNLQLIIIYGNIHLNYFL